MDAIEGTRRLVRAIPGMTSGGGFDMHGQF